jgi:hypothetical protein
MRKTLVTLAAATALAAGTTMVPTSANAFAAWIIPAIISAGVGGLAVGSAAGANAQAYNDAHAEAYDEAYAEPAPGNIYVRPYAAAPTCEIMRERTARGWRRVQVCR